ncbi:MAG: hypothetical protein SGJ09_14810 [Phycisphaerae bacterium]|nr:hypothetical protein [Phycisphaerae bacterium]
MIAPESLRYLGITAGAPPRRLLGLPEGELTVELIDAALERQRRRVARHPAAREAGAQRLVHDLAAAADMLRATAVNESARRGEVSSDRASANGGIQLTGFDREVLSTLVGSGGWNHESRSRLLAIAAAHGVGGPGLMKVLAGLAAALRSGALRPYDAPARSAIAELAPWRPSEPSRLTLAFEQLDEALAREVAGDTPGRLLRLVLFFVAIAIVGAYFLVAALQPSPVSKVAPQTPIVAAAEAARNAAPPVAPAVRIERPGVTTPVRWATPPNLRGAAPPDDARAALREVTNGASELAVLARKVQVEANRPSEAVFRTWEQIQSAYGRCWPLLDPVARTAAIEASVAVLRPVQADEVAARFLTAWAVDPVVLGDPLGSWRGAWAAGLLGEVAARPSSPDAVAAQAIDRLEAMVARRSLLKGRGTTVYEGAAGGWLDKAAQTMSASATDPSDFADRWERWFEAQQAVRSGATLQAAWLDAIGAVLAGGLAISESGPGSDLLGRLVGLADWTDRAVDQRRARDAMTVWFTEPSLASSRLWTLTSLLDLSYDAAWFVPEFVCDPLAALPDRGKLLERILAAWPLPTGIAATGGGIVVDSKSLERWRGLVERVDTLASATTSDRLLAAVLFARLNTAAQAFASGDEDLARADMVEIERELSAPRDRRAVGVAAAGRTSGTDGEFSAEYEAAGRDESKRRDALRSLRSRPAAGDLGPRDAELLVNEALRGTPSEIRGLAQEILAERYADGTTITQVLLEQLAGSPMSDATIDMIERVTREKFSPARGVELTRLVRLALVRKLLAFESSAARAEDALVRDFAAAYVERSRLFRIGFEDPPSDIAASAMVSRFADQWRVKAGSIFLADPFPAPLEELDRRRGVRRRLVEGEVQSCVAEQASLVDLMVAVAVADKPGLRQRMSAILQEVADRRGRAGSVVEQVLESERAIVRVYDLWFERSTKEASRKDGAS